MVDHDQDIDLPVTDLVRHDIEGHCQVWRRLGSECKLRFAGNLRLLGTFGATKFIELLLELRYKRLVSNTLGDYILSRAMSFPSDLEPAEDVAAPYD